MKRNNLHIFIGACLGYALTMLFGFPNRDNFPNDFRLYLAPIASSIIVGIIAFFWERYQDTIRVNASDINDVWRTMIGCYFGGLFAMFYSNLLFASIGLFISFGIVLIDVRKK
jgi:hypothetical protein